MRSEGEHLAIIWRSHDIQHDVASHWKDGKSDRTLSMLSLALHIYVLDYRLCLSH